MERLAEDFFNIKYTDDQKELLKQMYDDPDRDYGDPNTPNSSYNKFKAQFSKYRQSSRTPTRYHQHEQLIYKLAPLVERMYLAAISKEEDCALWKSGLKLLYSFDLLFDKMKHYGYFPKNHRRKATALQLLQTNPRFSIADAVVRPFGYDEKNQHDVRRYFTITVEPSNFYTVVIFENFQQIMFDRFLKMLNWCTRQKIALCCKELIDNKS